MAAKNITLPFIIKTQNEKENLTYPTEIAYIACVAELQRKKTSFLREAPERLSFLAKIYYPLWAVPAENQCLIIDGLGLMSHKFSFKEPTKTGFFIEELKKNSINREQFMGVLEKQTKKISGFLSSVNAGFKGLIADKELLTFFLEYFKTGDFLN